MKPLRPGPFRGDIAVPVQPQTDASTGEVTRAPLYVTAPWKRWPTPDLFPNLAALIVVSGAVPHAAPEPVYYKRATVQIDLPPNVAVRTTEAAYIARAAIDPVTRASITRVELFPNLAVQTAVAPYTTRDYIDPPVRRTTIGVELFPNLAVNAIAPPYSPRSYIDPVTRRAFTAIDLYPNLAIGPPETAQMMLPGSDAQTFIRRAPQIEQPPNLAVRTSSQVPLPAMWDVQLTRKLPAAPDLYPNIAVRANFATPPAAIDIQPTRKPALQPDLYPNIAVRAGAVYVPPPQLDIAPTERIAPQPFLFPNLAVQPPPAAYVPPPPVEIPVQSKRAQPPDLSPNIAVRVTVLAYIPPAPIDPIIGKRVAPTLELLPNIAVGFSVPYVPLATPDMPNFKRSAPQIDVYPNLAVRVRLDYIPPESPEPLIRRVWTSVELAPNLALRAPLAQMPPLVAVEPWIAKRRWPQVDVIQNRAIYAPPEVFRPRSLIIDPIRSRVTWQQGWDIFPNLAVRGLGHLVGSVRYQIRRLRARRFTVHAIDDDFTVQRLRARRFTVSNADYLKFEAMYAGEKIPLTFDFTPDLTSDELPPGVLLTGSPTVTVTVSSGTDPSPSAILNGSPGLDVTGLKVIVPVAPAVPGVSYLITVHCASTQSTFAPTLKAALEVWA